MPAVFINGPRQAGKSTLVSKIAQENLDADYITFDDISALSFAKSNTAGFLQNFRKPLVIDEVQMVPEIFIHLKQTIDNKRLMGENANGQFLLTGSSTITTVPFLSEALVGRVFLITLYPFSSSEIAQHNDRFISMIFREEGSFSNIICEPISLSDIIARATFPQLATEKNININGWFGSYINTLLNRDVRNIAQIEKLHELPYLLKVLASRAGGLINDADLARTTRLNQMTLRRYRTLLQQVFLIFTVPSWYENIGKRLVKAPKIYFTDTLLLTYLLGYDVKALKAVNMNLLGMVLENFVATELIKQLSVTGVGNLFYFRTHDNKEVDFIIERQNGKIVGIEVKNSATVRAEDFNGLKFLKDALKDRFIRGIVMYTGSKILSFENDLVALPVSLLWA
jgi:predicted AAA+ superfamily ATPase